MSSTRLITRAKSGLPSLLPGRPGASRTGFLLACVLVGVVAPVRAQSPADRSELEAFRDSIGATTDSVALLALERRMIEAAKADRRNVLQHLRLGFLSLRLGDLGGRSHYEDAASEFEWARDLQPGWPYAWYGLGLAEFGAGDSEVSLVAGLQTMFGKDHLTRAAMAFGKSAEVDPSFVKGLVELAATSLRQRVNVKIELALQALRQAATTSAGAHPEVLLYRGRVERDAGDIDSALAAFRQYLDRGGTRGIGLLEVARTRLLQGSLEGGAQYYEGAASDDSVTVSAYRADLVPLVSDSVLAEFDQRNGEGRVAYLRSFWTERDQTEMRRPGERLREHYRRLYYARKNFSLVSLHRHYDIVERFRSGSQDFDDRGVIYIRHGEPSDRARSTVPGLEPNESWLYRRADGDLIFHFIAREDVQDYKLVESVFDVLGFSNTVALRGGPRGIADNAVLDDLLRTRERFSPVYSRLLTSGGAGASKYLTEERSQGRRSIVRGTTSDSYELEFPRDLKVRAEALAVGWDSSKSLMQVAYAIPGSALEPVDTPRGSAYPVRVRLAVSDRQGRVVADLDSTTLFLSATPVPAGEHLVGRVAVPVPPGDFRYRVAIQQGSDAGTVFPLDSLTVGRFDGTQFSLSDLVIGHPSTNLTWRPSASDTVYFNPLGSYARGSVMELYYEVYGLPEGAEYRTQIAVTKKGGGGKFLGIFGSKKAAISVSFQDRSQGRVSQIRRSLGLERLKPGSYSIELTVRTPDGQQQTAAQEFQVSQTRGGE